MVSRRDRKRRTSFHLRVGINNAIKDAGSVLQQSIHLAGASVAARPIGWWVPEDDPPTVGENALARAVRRINQPVYLVEVCGRPAVAVTGRVLIGEGSSPSPDAMALLALVLPLPAARLGDPAFRAAHRLRYAYVAGAMANGIGSCEIVEAMARAGMVGFFGAAGLSIDRVEAAIDRIQRNVGSLPYGFNLIHSPDDPGLESRIVDLYLRRQVRLVSASAYLDLTLPLVRYRLTGVYATGDGAVTAPNRVIAKVSRTEVAGKFLSPAPEAMVEKLVAEGAISSEQAQLARRIPMAEDITAEADSGGHTDNRPAITLLPALLALRDELQQAHGYAVTPRIGLAGGIATPGAVAAAFSMGAAYVLTGSINQACVEAGTSPAVREMLAAAGPADVAMAPAADMFEMGVNVQVLKWGTMFAVRARKLYHLYRSLPSLEGLSPRDRAMLERDCFRCPLDQAWARTEAFFETRDRGQIERASRDPKHKMALLFRAYLGQSSDWANRGDPSRRADYQVWCGPAMGAFNQWVRGSFLERPDQRDVVTVGLNLMVGAGAVTRAAALRAQGIELPPAAHRFDPLARSELQDYV